MQQGNFIDVFLALHVSGTYAYLQEHQMLSCSMWFSAPNFWMGGGLENCCVGHVYGADGAMRHATPAPYTGPTQRLSRPPSTHSLSAESHMLQLNI